MYPGRAARLAGVVFLVVSAGLAIARCKSTGGSAPGAPDCTTDCGPEGGDSAVPVESSDHANETTDVDGENDATSSADGGLPCGSAVWAKVPTPAECPIDQADTSHWCAALPAWSDCGPGCQRRKIQIAPGVVGAIPVQISAAYVGNRMLARLSSIWTPTGAAVYWLEDVDNAELVAALAVEQGPAQCAITYTRTHTPTIWSAVFDKKYFVGHGPDSSGKIVWQTQTLPSRGALETFFDVWGSGGFWGATFFNGELDVVSSLDATDWSTAEPAAGYATFSAAARGDLLIYPRWNGTQYELKGYTKGAGPVVLYSGSDNPVSVALSDTTMAWAGATGPYLSSGLYMSTTLSWSPIAKQSPDVHVTSVPTPPFNAGMTDLDVAGDFIATTGCTTRQDFTGTQCRVAVLQLSHPLIS